MDFRQESSSDPATSDPATSVTLLSSISAELPSPSLNFHTEPILHAKIDKIGPSADTIVAIGTVISNLESFGDIATSPDCSGIDEPTLESSDENKKEIDQPRIIA